MPMAERTLIMDPERVERKLQRIARQVYEKHFEEEELLVIGIQEDGERIAQRLANILEEVSTLRIRRGSLNMNKRAPLSEQPETSIDPKEMDDVSAVLVDDVVNSGRTLAYAARHLLGRPLSSLTTVALVDREHHLFPIRPDLVGTTLATTMKEHIRVESDQAGERVYLE